MKWFKMLQNRQYPILISACGNNTKYGKIGSPTFTAHHETCASMWIGCGLEAAYRYAPKPNKYTVKSFI